MQNLSDTSQTALNMEKSEYVEGKIGPTNINGMQKVEINMGNIYF